jgi:hypothetical protein
MLTRIALYVTLGTVLSALGHSINDTGFWCMVALFFACDVLARKEGQDNGIWITLSLPADKLKELKQQLDADVKDLD